MIFRKVIASCFMASILLNASTVYAMPTPALPTIPEKVFRVTDYGVVADGTTDNAVSIQKTINAASLAGGGKVLFPASAKAYISGPIVLASHINLCVDAGATLQTLAYSKYVTSKIGDSSFYQNWLSATNDTDIEISGRGIINGNGSDWWTAFNANKSMPHRPYLIRIGNCIRVHVHQLRLSNSPMFHMMVIGNEVTVDSLLITAPSSAPNTDGVDPAGQNILMYDDSIMVGDDNVAVKPYLAFCKNIHVKNCYFGTGHGFSIGGQTNLGLDSLLVEHCTFKGTDYGLRLKASRIAGGLVNHLTYTDLTMINVKEPVYFYSYYNDSSDPFTGKAAALLATTPYWKNIVVKNVTATGATGSVLIEGLPEATIDSVLFSNVSITGKTGFTLAHAHVILFQSTTYNGSSSGMIAKQVDATVSNVPPVSLQPRYHTVANNIRSNNEFLYSFLITANGQRIPPRNKVSHQVVFTTNMPHIWKNSVTIK